MNFVFMGIGPFVLLIVLNLLTFKGLTVVDSENGGRCASSFGTSQPPAFQSSSKKNEMLLAKVSLTIVFIFILCHSVKWIPNIFELLRFTFLPNFKEYFCLLETSYLCWQFNTFLDHGASYKV